MFKFICAVAIVLNTAMFMFNTMAGYHMWAAANIGSALLCWIPFINQSQDKENKDDK